MTKGKADPVDGADALDFRSCDSVHLNWGPIRHAKFVKIADFGVLGACVTFFQNDFHIETCVR
jgi:hypothetical protein